MPPPSTPDGVPRLKSRRLSVAGLNALPPPDVRRGVPFMNVCRSFGKVFRVHPNSLDIPQKTELFASSVQTERIYAFISHSWGSPGYQKYFSLLIYESGPAALVTATITGLVCLILQKYVWKLPYVVVEGAFDPVFEVYQESQPWEFIFCFLVGMCSFFFWGIKGTVKTKLFFLDCMCIHQTDIVKKMAGIQALGGFVVMSDHLYVMWDSQYFSRLWCVYELAVYKAIHRGEHNVSILPLRQSVAVLILIPAFFVGFLIYTILFPLVAQWGIATFYLAAFAASTLVFTGAAIVGYDFADQLRILEHQLTTFEVRTAECFAPEDRAEILNKIASMFPGDGLDEFNDIVRGDLKDDVMKEVRHTPRTILPYKTLMVGLISAVGFMFFGIAWFRDSNSETFWSFLIYMVTFCWAMMPVCACLSLNAGESLYKTHPPPEGEVGLAQAFSRNKFRYAFIAMKSAGIFILLWTSLAFVAPLAAANSDEEGFLGIFGKDSAIWISVVTCAPCYAVAYWTFKPSSLGQTARIDMEVV